MKTNSLKNEEFDQYIITVERKYRPTVKALRELVLEAIPDAVEELKWNNLHYSKANTIC